MDRREFAAGAAGVLGSAALGLPGQALAQGRPLEGRDYRALDKRAAVDAPAGKVEVIEFFWYSCPHCNAFEPRLVGWTQRMPQDVVLKRVPVHFRDDFVPQQRLFYTLEAMGKLGELHGKVFHAIHQEKKPTNTEPLILEFAQGNGLDPKQFQQVYNSFAVESKTGRARQLQKQYEVEGVPALGVAGRWYTDATMAGSMEKMLQVVDYLIAEARKTK
jgi:protein dithiol oxidoreductase (disulfide-forming)